MSTDDNSPRLGRNVLAGSGPGDSPEQTQSTGSEPTTRSPNANSSPDSPKTSFVYPIRSLLAGIQPSAIQPSSNQSPRLPPADRSKPTFAQNISDMLKDERTNTGNAPRRSVSDSQAPSEQAASGAISPPASKPTTANFRDYPGQERDDNGDPFSPRTFISAPLPNLTTPITESTTFFTAGPTGEPVAYTPPREVESFDLRRPANISEIAADVFLGTQRPLLPPKDAKPAPHELFNLSESGIVHLGPVDSDGSCETDSSRARSSLPGSSLLYGGRASVSPLQYDLGPGGSAGSHHGSSADCVPEDPISNMSSSAHGSRDHSQASSEPPITTFRFEHKEDEDGHHVVVGREGKLTRCEDEPIRTPGAIQGFGVLIVVEEDEETGNLVVRQVSENSFEILGFRPKYLFSLNCFTETLSDSQADILWDNIQYLNDPEPSDEGRDDSPHVFLLSGWGEPQSPIPDDPHFQYDARGRRLWSCWCAAHRPLAMSVNQGSAVNAPANPSLIVLEFELERDQLNPLYPPANLASVGSAGSADSPLSVISGGGGSPDTQSTESSGRTLVDTQGTATVTEGSFQSGTASGPESPAAPISVISVEQPLNGLGLGGLTGDEEWVPTPEQILESTTNRAKPLMALERLRRMSRISDSSPSPASVASRRGRRGGRGRGNARRTGGSGGGPGAVGMMDVFAVMAEINEQLGAAPDLEMFLKVVVGVIKDLTQFHRVLVYQFDESWNGETVAELVDWNQTHDLYKGLHFPASDIPAQARQLYTINKTRLLYDRTQTTARIVVRDVSDLDPPLNMTHCYLRSMSPIHLKYLANMGVRASMSVSIMAFDQLWGLVACHSYGNHGVRVSFPVRQMLRLLSQSISRNVERLSYAQRLHTRKLINTMSSEQHPSGYIVSNADDLLGLFDADFGMLVIGEGAKILGPNQHSQEILIMAEYLRLKQFTSLHVSHIVTKDYPDLQLTMGLEVIAGLLYVPLSSGGKDFIAFMRKGQPKEVQWAGKPYKDGHGERSSLEPRKSFRAWSETVAGRCRQWTDEQLETAGVLALVYGKFIEVWRQKENALQTTKLTEILLSNASHEVRTPLNHIINYLELAMNGPLDLETRDNLKATHAASKSLLFTINDLLDLTRLESGNETSFNEPFDLRATIEDAVQLYRKEAGRRNIDFFVNVDLAPIRGKVLGDAKKIKTAVANLAANALKYTEHGNVTVTCKVFDEPEGLRDPKQIAVEISVADTGCGIPSTKMESIFREFEQVESSSPRPNAEGLGLGLAVVARIVEQLGGQLRVDSRLGEGSRFSFLIPFALSGNTDTGSSRSQSSKSSSRAPQFVAPAPDGSRSNELAGLLEAFASHSLIELGQADPSASIADELPVSPPLADDATPVPLLTQHTSVITIPSPPTTEQDCSPAPAKPEAPPATRSFPKIHAKSRSIAVDGKEALPRLRVLIVEDDEINRAILAKRLTLDGHMVVNTTNGQEGVVKLAEDMEFDCVLMDIQMPILNGFEATKKIREMEQDPAWGAQLSKGTTLRLSHRLNGRIPIFAVSASLVEEQRSEMIALGLDGWMLKPVDFKRLRLLMKGVVDPSQRVSDLYASGYNWEAGGWLIQPKLGPNTFS